MDDLTFPLGEGGPLAVDEVSVSKCFIPVLTIYRNKKEKNKIEIKMV